MIVGRKKERKELLEAYKSQYSEFVAVTGRRRVGKTFLIREVFDYKFAFQHSGLANQKTKVQLQEFRASLLRCGMKKCKVPEDWFEAFHLLGDFLSSLPEGKKVVFIDELPWMDAPRSQFVSALEHFWNGFASARKDILLIICGSATSWIINNVFRNHGGLHNRVTHRIHLQPFTLRECELYAKSLHLSISRYEILECYMVLGGIPFYWSLLERGMSVSQNIDNLFFNKNGKLRNEYNDLYNSLFKNPEPYIKIVEALSKNKQGLTRNEISSVLKVSSSGTLSKQLENLVYCDIIRRYETKVNGKPKTNDAYFQLIDLFTLFHLNFRHQLTTDDYWEQRINTPTINIWQGLAFEHVCMSHIQHIRHALGLDKIAVEYYSWRSSKSPRAQVDMIIERADRLINLCEIKYCQSEYVITAEEDMKFRNRIAAFIRESKTRYGILPTWITSYGLFENEYSSNVSYQITMDDLFVNG